MKKSIQIILIFFVSFIYTPKVIGQTAKYIGGTIEYEINGVTKPLGKNVTLIYDTFFKSYTVTYTDINGSRFKLTFEYENGNQYKCNGVLYNTLFPESTLNNGNTSFKGSIMFSDLRHARYGGTNQTFIIKKLSKTK